MLENYSRRSFDCVRKKDNKVTEMWKYFKRNKNQSFSRQVKAKTYVDETQPNGCNFQALKTRTEKVGRQSFVQCRVKCYFSSQN